MFIFFFTASFTRSLDKTAAKFGKWIAGVLSWEFEKEKRENGVITFFFYNKWILKHKQSIFFVYNSSSEDRIQIIMHATPILPLYLILCILLKPYHYANPSSLAVRNFILIADESLSFWGIRFSPTLCLKYLFKCFFQFLFTIKKNLSSTLVNDNVKIKYISNDIFYLLSQFYRANLDS